MLSKIRNAFTRKKFSKETYNKPLLGYRTWRVSSYNNILLAATNDSPWQPGDNRAFCVEGFHRAPARRCQCGFNGYYRFEETFSSPYEGLAGAFAGAGKIEIHETGFRSERAQLIALFSHPEAKKRADRVGEVYSIPVFTNLKDFLSFAESKAETINDFIKENLHYQDQIKTPLVKNSYNAAVQSLNNNDNETLVVTKKETLGGLLAGLVLIVGIWGLSTIEQPKDSQNNLQEKAPIEKEIKLNHQRKIQTYNPSQQTTSENKFLIEKEIFANK